MEDGVKDLSLRAWSVTANRNVSLMLIYVCKEASASFCIQVWTNQFWSNFPLCLDATQQGEGSVQ